ncbi:MAG: hypothetical protein AAGT88_01605 [Dethiobacter sp.]
MPSRDKYMRYERDLFLKESYAFDRDSGRIVIELLLEKQIYLFNEWDNAALNRKDLDPDLVYFLEECFDEIPFEYEVQLKIAINERERDPVREAAIAEGIQSQFRHYMRANTRKLKELYKRAALYVLISTGFLLLASLLEGRPLGRPINAAMLQGLYVGGWVFLWEAISEVSFSRGSAALTQKIKTYKRFLRAPIVFIGVEQDKPKA